MVSWGDFMESHGRSCGNYEPTMGPRPTKMMVHLKPTIVVIQWDAMRVYIYIYIHMYETNELEWFDGL